MATDTELIQSSSDWWRAIRIAVLALAAGAAGTANGASWRITPEIGVSQTLSDNPTLLADDSGETGWVTTITPALRVNGQGARVNGFLDFRRDESYYYGGNSSINAARTFLTSYATLEAVDNWLYVDGAASVTPRASSFFSGPNTVNASNAVDNQEQTQVVQLSPYIRGRAFGETEYLFRLHAIDARSDNDTLAHTQVGQFTGSLRNPGGTRSIGWFADFNGVRVDSDAFGSRSDDRGRVGLILPVTHRLHLLVNSGRETTDFISGTSKSLSTHGYGFDWQPSERLRATGMREKRFFGHGHELSLFYRTARTAWRYLDFQDVAVLPSGLAGFNRGSVYDLMSDLLTASIADPIERDEAARARTDQTGRIGGAFDTSGVLGSRIFMDRSRQVSLALLGMRSVMTILLQQRDQELLDGVQPTGVVDDFSLSPKIRDSGALLSWVHQTTPSTTLNISALYSKRKGLSVPDLEAIQRSGTVSLTFQLSPKASASVAARVTNFSTLENIGSIHERALVGSLIQRF